MNPSQPSKRRRREIRLVPEMLEARELMTGGVGDTFAILPGTVTKANQTAAIKFTIDPTHFTIPKGKLMLGIDIAPGSGSNIDAKIVSVINPNGTADSMTRARYAKGLPSGSVAAGSPTTAVLAPVQFNHKNPSASVTYTVKVRGLKGTTGGFLLGFYLPGNASGSGTVAAADLKDVQAEVGQNASSSTYTFDADANRDGKIDKTDVAITEENMGAATTINPTVTSNLDPASQTMANDRVVNTPSAFFTGTATPGASITYQSTATGSKPVTTTADTLGNYSITVPLVLGNNTFNVTTLDAFGQSITGTLSPVTYALPTKTT